jgi:hypothetical protein
MVDQRDTLQYMDAPLLCYADKFFDRRATYKVKTVCSRIDACDGRLDGVRILYWSQAVFEDEISRMRSPTRAELSQRSRPTAARASMVPFFIYVRGATTGRGVSLQ